MRADVFHEGDVSHTSARLPSPRVSLRWSLLAKVIDGYLPPPPPFLVQERPCCKREALAFRISAILQLNELLPPAKMERHKRSTGRRWRAIHHGRQQREREEFLMLGHLPSMPLQQEF